MSEFIVVYFREILKIKISEICIVIPDCIYSHDKFFITLVTSNNVNQKIKFRNTAKIMISDMILSWNRRQRLLIIKHKNDCNVNCIIKFHIASTAMSSVMTLNQLKDNAQFFLSIIYCYLIKKNRYSKYLYIKKKIGIKFLVHFLRVFDNFYFILCLFLGINFN